MFHRLDILIFLKLRLLAAFLLNLHIEHLASRSIIVRAGGHLTRLGLRHAMSTSDGSSVGEVARHYLTVSFIGKLVLFTVKGLPRNLSKAVRAHASCHLSGLGDRRVEPVHALKELVFIRDAAWRLFHPT